MLIIITITLSYDDVKTLLYEAVNLIKSENMSTHEFSVIINNFRDVLNKKQPFKIRHIFKKADQCVYALVKMSARGSFCLCRKIRLHLYVCLC